VRLRGLVYLWKFGGKGVYPKTIGGVGVYPKTMAIPPIPDDLRPLTATELRWKEYETFSQAYKNAKFVEDDWFKSWCVKHNPVYVNAPCNLSPTAWFRALLECYQKETTVQNRRDTISFDMFGYEKSTGSVGGRPVSGPSHLHQKDLEQFAKECKPHLHAWYLKNVEQIEKEIKKLETQLQDTSLSQIRKEVIPQHIASERKKLEEEDKYIQDFFEEIENIITLISKYDNDVLEKQEQSIKAHFQLRFNELDCLNPFTRDEQYKALETIEKELHRYQKLCQIVDGKNIQAPIQTVESKIAEIRLDIENNINEHKRKRLSSIEYNLDVLQRGVDEERFADNEGFRCVLDVLKLMNENKQTKR